MPLSAAQICQLARQIAKAPAGYLQQSGAMLNLVMQDLVLKRDLRVNLIVETIPVATNSNGPFNLAANHLRTYDMFFQLNGITFFLNPVELAQYDAEVASPQLANYPYEYAVDSSPQATGLPQIFYIYPQCNQAITLTHRYFNRQPEIVSPELSALVPWFIDQDYLVHATATRLMAITDDTRYTSFLAIGEEMLRKYLIMEGDKRNLTARVKLDPQLFKRQRSSRPTKETG